MQLHREVFRELARAAAARPELGRSYLWSYLRGTYAASQAAGIRRQAHHDRRPGTLARLLVEIEAEPGRVTRAFYLSHFAPGERAQAERRFDQQLAGIEGSHVAPALLLRDRRVLAQVASNVEQELARDAEDEDASPPLDLDFPIDTVARLFDRYSEILTGVSAGVPSVRELEPDWPAVLRAPWLGA